MKSAIDFRTPAAGFDAPIDLWLACHQRVHRFAAMLPRLARHIEDRGSDHDAQVAASSIRRYFNEAAPRHHEDEEQDLFPLLREKVGSDPAVSLALDHVEQDHLTMARLWARLDATLAQIGHDNAPQLHRADIAEYERLYRQHIEIEETVLLPAMQQHFSAAEWQAIGRSMAERRGLDWAQLQS